MGAESKVFSQGAIWENLTIPAQIKKIPYPYFNLRSLPNPDHVSCPRTSAVILPFGPFRWARAVALPSSESKMMFRSRG